MTDAFFNVIVFPPSLLDLCLVDRLVLPAQSLQPLALAACRSNPHMESDGQVDVSSELNRGNSSRAGGGAICSPQSLP